MSDTYISDKASTIYKDNARTAADDRYARFSAAQDIMNEIGDISTSGPEIGFMMAQRMKKMFYKNASGSELFLDSVLKKYRQKYDMTDNELKFLSEISTRLPEIQYKNAGGIIYAYRYSMIYNESRNQNEIKRKLREMVIEAKERDVPTFDIIRYVRLLQDYKIIAIRTNIEKIKME